MNQEIKYLDAWDYSIFGVLLSISALIGTYFAFFARQKQDTMFEYLLGGRRMGVYPISMSLTASYISAVTVIGFASESYTYGTQLSMLVFTELFAAAGVAYLILPVFYGLEIYSSYQYFSKRFGPGVRTVASGLFTCFMLLFLPLMIYVPALALSSVSGLSFEILIPVVCLVCIFYTALGGIKAVVWADTVQMVVMIGGSLTIAIMGTQQAGGFAAVWQRASETERLEFFNFSVDPTIRHTFWTVVIGRFVMAFGRNTSDQASVQRCLALPTLKKAQIATAIFICQASILNAIAFYTGIVMFAAFFYCDPLMAGHIRKSDEILPYFVMQVTRHLYFIPGIFMSAVFSATLSTMASGLNSTCGIIVEDLIKPYWWSPISDKKAAFLMKIITVVLGIICTLLAFVVDRLGDIVQLVGAVLGITSGTFLGMFILGMMLPWANSSGAIAGGISGAAVVLWTSMGSLAAQHNKEIVYAKRFTSISACSNETFDGGVNSSQLAVETNLNLPFYLYRISYLYYPVIALVVVVSVGMLVSWGTGFTDPAELDIKLLSPAIHRFIPQSTPKNTNKRKLNGEVRFKEEQHF